MTRGGPYFLSRPERSIRGLPQEQAVVRGGIPPTPHESPVQISRRPLTPVTPRANARDSVTPGESQMIRKLAAEVFGTFWLVFAVLGSALMAAGVPDVGLGWIGVSFAAGLAVLTMAYAVGGISGGHFNPAVSLGLAIANRFDWRELIPYWIAQIVGGVIAAVIVYVIAASATGFTAGGFASNGYGELSPGGYSMVAGFIAEAVLTGMFLIIILGSTSQAAPAGFAPLTIGLGLAVVHFVGIPVTNASVNPARSIAAAIFAQNGAMGQLWLFIVAPLVGAALGAAIWRYLLSPGESPAGVGRPR